MDAEIYSILVTLAFLAQTLLKLTQRKKENNPCSKKLVN